MDAQSTKGAKLKVIGVGGAGGNALNRHIATHVKGVTFIAANTDLQDLLASNATTKIQLGPLYTRGLGAGSNPEIGQKAATTSTQAIGADLQGATHIFDTAGMGGGSDSGAAPIVAKIAKDQGAHTVGVVTRHFTFTGPKRAKNATQGIAQLKETVDTLDIIANNRLLTIVHKKTPMHTAFTAADNVLRQGVQGLSHHITSPGYVNLHFADVKTVMANQGSAHMGIGSATGTNRTVTATKKAISSPLLEVNISGAKQVLLKLTGGPDLSLLQAQDASQIVADAAKEHVNIIFGTSLNTQLGDTVVDTDIATGITTTHQRRTTTRRPAAANRNTHQTQSNGSYRPNFGGTQQSADQAPKKQHPFGNWDLRRTPSKRQTPSAEHILNVKLLDLHIFELQTNADDADSEHQPHFFKQRRRQ